MILYCVINKIIKLRLEIDNNAVSRCLVDCRQGVTASPRLKLRITTCEHWCIIFTTYTTIFMFFAQIWVFSVILEIL